jgi:hypothetical protein
MLGRRVYFSKLMKIFCWSHFCLKHCDIGDITYHKRITCDGSLFYDVTDDVMRV